MRRGGGRVPALIERVTLTEEEEEGSGRDSIFPRGFRPPSGPSLECRHFQVSHKIVLTTTLLRAGIPVSSSSSSTVILSARLAPMRRRAISLTEV